MKAWDRTNRLVVSATIFGMSAVAALSVGSKCATAALGSDSQGRATIAASAFQLADLPDLNVAAPAQLIGKLRANDRLQRAGEAGLDVALLLADEAGNKTKVGSMPFLVAVPPEISFVRLRAGLRALVIVTVVEPETSGKHLKTATIISWVQGDGSIAPLWSHAEAFGPDTMASARVLRYDSAVLLPGARTADLVLAQTSISGQSHVQTYRLSGNSLNRIYGAL
ncbi:MAG: hypothetical protein GIW99_09505 [Candidatus Eremiobacteraeota bacterium]|nr:hypothetical protein [Candidatus Eremiobacteraeota bacterium]MBC5827897.1 hypothetical protein [Candidatus Eremiobacteraeota bacterium]